MVCTLVYVDLWMWSVNSAVITSVCETFDLCDFLDDCALTCLKRVCLDTLEE